MKGTTVNFPKTIWWAITVFLIGVICYIIDPNFIIHPLYIFAKDLAALFITIMGIYIANGGLFTWKDQLKYNKEVKIANDLHYSLLKLRNAIKSVRNPAIFPSESYRAEQGYKEKYPEKSDLEISKNSHAYVYEMRWQEISDAFTEMESHLLEAEVLWGLEVRRLLVPLKQKVTELNIALKQNFQSEFRTKDPMKIHDIMYDKSDWSNDREDAFSNEVSTAIKNITDYMNAKIS